jgi:hypothetical protein
MPRPVKIQLLSQSVSPMSERPDHAILLAEISREWGNVERELALLFGYGLLPAELAISAAILGCTSNLTTRLSMTRTSLSLGVNKACGDAFWKLFGERARKVSLSRAKMVHAIWECHTDYPEDIIWTSGIMDPYGQTILYSIADLTEIRLGLLKLHVDLQAFFSSLFDEYPSPMRDDQPKYWRFATPDTLASDRLDLSNPTDPE